MRNIALFSVLTFAVSIASAQQTPEDIIRSFFDALSNSNYAQAVKSMPLSNQLKTDSVFADRTIENLRNAEDEKGEYCGYELIKKEEVSPSFITYNYFIKYQDAPQKIQFVFYKPEDSWQLNKLNLAATAARRNPRQRFRM